MDGRVTNSTYTCTRWIDIQSQYISPLASGVTGQCLEGEPATVDTVLSDDIFIRGIEVMCDAVRLGTVTTIQIIDTNGITGVPPGTVVATPVNKWNIPEISKMLSYEAVVPFKAPATFTIRITVIPPSEEPLNFAINYLFLKILK